ncbi:MAG TPA: protein-disulfide reductase DsbD domain-containing protein [Thermohalobaculum sp.]|nr:protein-disulfide reductase DsbD domain-containing protein [Thermohalobaculum sp.]
MLGIVAGASILAAAFPAPRGAAQAIVSSGESFVDARLLVGEPRDDGSRDAGLELRVEPGWKTYWRAPGEAGIPPRFDWSRSANLAGVEVGWPAPQVFESFGLQTVGYAGTVVLPLRLTPQDPARPIDAVLDLALGVCRDICVLEETELGASIAPGAPGPAAMRIALARAAEPPAAEAAGIGPVSCRIAGTGEDRAFTATLGIGQTLADPFVVLEAPEETGWFHGTSAMAEGGTLEVSSTLTLASDDAWIDRSALRMTVLDPALVADIQGCSAS